MKLIRSLMLLGAALIIMVTAGCGQPEDPAAIAEFQKAPVVLSGNIPYGGADLRTTSSGVVKGKLPYGRALVNRIGNAYSGDTPFGRTNLTYVDGLLSGKAPYGGINVRISETTVTGRIPYGSVNLTLNGNQITGTLPYGRVTLTLGANYKTLNDPDVVLALAALLSDKT